MEFLIKQRHNFPVHWRFQQILFLQFFIHSVPKRCHPTKVCSCVPRPSQVGIKLSTRKVKHLKPTCLSSFSLLSTENTFNSSQIQKLSTFLLFMFLFIFFVPPKRSNACLLCWAFKQINCCVVALLVKLFGIEARKSLRNSGPTIRRTAALFEAVRTVTLTSGVPKYVYHTSTLGKSQGYCKRGPS